MEIRKILRPKNLNNDIETFPHYDKLLTIAEKRTIRFVFEYHKLKGNIPLDEILAAAYIQGFSDAVRVLKDDDGKINTEYQG